MPLPGAVGHVTTLVVAFEKEADMTTEELREYYHEEHVPLVNEVPNLQGYEVTFPRDPGESAFDAVARLEFESPAAMGAAMDTDAAAAMQADAANFVAEGSMVQLVGETEDVLE
jgi:uncharacterized protein (TIGR02118 family)